MVTAGRHLISFRRPRTPRIPATSLDRPLPPALERLLGAADGSPVERAWAAFVEEYARLILHVARSQGGEYDTVMDRYTHVLEQLRRDDFRRLRGYTADGRGKFTTWLVVVVRRLCIDQARARYGRQRAGGEDVQGQRQRLADLVGAEIDVDLLEASGPSPEDRLRREELVDRLNAAIVELEPADRLLLRLRFHDEASAAEIARVLSFPDVFHVYRNLNRIYARLRASLSEAGIRDAAP
jgi:RNA polymerase sigma factor (sigma-70 family)